MEIRELSTMQNTPSEVPGPGFKWPVAVQRNIAAPAGDVWDVISTPGNLGACHPFCLKNPVLAWPGPDARDELYYLNGWVFERQFFRWIEGVGYDLEIGRRGGGKTVVSWRIEPRSDGACTLGITTYPHMLQNMPPLIRWLPHLLRVRPLLRAYLEHVVKGFEWYVVHREPVQHNQFGTHPWFSKLD